MVEEETGTVKVVSSPFRGSSSFPSVWALGRRWDIGLREKIEQKNTLNPARLLGTILGHMGRKSGDFAR